MLVMRWKCFFFSNASNSELEVISGLVIGPIDHCVGGQWSISFCYTLSQNA